MWWYKYTRNTRPIFRNGCIFSRFRSVFRRWRHHPHRSGLSHAHPHPPIPTVTPDIDFQRVRRQLLRTFYPSIEAPLKLFRIEASFATSFGDLGPHCLRFRKQVSNVHTRQGRKKKAHACIDNLTRRNLAYDTIKNKFFLFYYFEMTWKGPK